MRDSQFARRIETAVDIAVIAGTNILDSDDSREDVAKIISLAEEFEQHRVCPPDGEETYFGKPYMEAIEAFTIKKLGLSAEDRLRSSKWQAMRNFLEVWTDGQLAYDIGPRLNCTECDTLVALFRAYDCEETAKALLEGHAAEDEDDDNPEHVALRDRLEAEQLARRGEVDNAVENVNTWQPTEEVQVPRPPQQAVQGLDED